MSDLKLSPETKFRATSCNSDQVMADKPNLQWKLPPSWIYFRCQLWSHDLFPVMTGYTPAKFHKYSSIGGWVITFCVKKYNMAAAAILNYHFVILDHPRCPRSPLTQIKLPFKFRVDRVCTFRYMTIWIFHKFGLKFLLRSFYPWTLLFYNLDHQKHFHDDRKRV